MSADALDALALVEDVAGLRVEQAGDGLQGGGLTGTVGTDEGDDLALVHLEEPEKNTEIKRYPQNISQMGA